jgi:hypothetical protein
MRSVYLGDLLYYQTEDQEGYESRTGLPEDQEYLDMQKGNHHSMGMMEATDYSLCQRDTVRYVL